MKRLRTGVAVFGRASAWWIAVSAFTALFLLSACAREPVDASENDTSSQTPLESPDAEYVFPVGAPRRHLEWTEYHWDGGNAVDIFAARRLDSDSMALSDVHSAPVLAVADGSAFRVDNPRGGNAVLLKAETGEQFYYAHLADTVVPDDRTLQSSGTPVSKGEQIGTVGRSGSRARFIEPHLHFEVIKEEVTSLDWPDHTNAAHWIRGTFGLRWVEQNIADYGEDTPSGFPLDYRPEAIERFESMAQEQRQTAGVVYELQDESPVRSLHGGEIRVMRNTRLGLRVQVTNRPTDTTVVYSFLRATDVETGDTVERGDEIGTAHNRLHIMYFEDGRSRDPEAIPGWNRDNEK
ncbi:MAG: peptidoglycan DD-metalloendopeptidase family protein [Spirochaetales bacterium]